MQLEPEQRCPVVTRDRHAPFPGVADRMARLPRRWAERPINEVANVAFLGMAAYSVISSLLVPLLPLCLATRVQDAHPVLRELGTVLGITLSIGFGIGLWRQWRLTCKHGASVAAERSAAASATRRTRQQQAQAARSRTPAGHSRLWSRPWAPTPLPAWVGEWHVFQEAIHALRVNCLCLPAYHTTASDDSSKLAPIHLPAARLCRRLSTALQWADRQAGR